MFETTETYFSVNRFFISAQSALTFEMSLVQTTLIIKSIFENNLFHSTLILHN